MACDQEWCTFPDLWAVELLTRVLVTHISFSWSCCWHSWVTRHTFSHVKGTCFRCGGGTGWVPGIPACRRRNMMQSACLFVLGKLQLSNCLSLKILLQKCQHLGCERLHLILQPHNTMATLSSRYFSGLSTFGCFIGSGSKQGAISEMWSKTFHNNAHMIVFDMRCDGYEPHHWNVWENCCKSMPILMCDMTYTVPLLKT